MFDQDEDIREVETLSYEEKTIVVYLFNMLLIFGYYLLNLYRLYENSERVDPVSVFSLWATVIVIGIIAAIASTIITQIVLAIYTAVVTREYEEEPMIADERDKLISLKGTRNAYALFSIGVFVSMGTFALGSEPLVMFNYKPNWVLLKYEGKFVDFPKWAAECETDPAWGTNPDLTYDCGNAESGWLKKAVYSGLEKSHPCALELIRNISFTDEMVGDAFYIMDVDKLSAEKGAQAWLEKYGTAADAWVKALPESCSTS